MAGECGRALLGILGVLVGGPARAADPEGIAFIPDARPRATVHLFECQLDGRAARVLFAHPALSGVRTLTLQFVRLDRPGSR